MFCAAISFLIMCQFWKVLTSLSEFQDKSRLSSIYWPRYSLACQQFTVTNRACICSMSKSCEMLIVTIIFLK